MNKSDRKGFKKFWQVRAQGYRKLEWATRGEYLQRFAESGNFRRNDKVLNVGSGTGIIFRLVVLCNFSFATLTNYTRRER